MKLKFFFLMIAMLSIAAVITGCKDDDDNEPGIRPVISLSLPENNVTDVSRNIVITVQFSETMEASTINANTFTLHKGVAPVSGAVAYSGTTATFTPANPLDASSTYT